MKAWEKYFEVEKQVVEKVMKVNKDAIIKAANLLTRTT